MFTLVMSLLVAPSTSSESLIIQNSKPLPCCVYMAPFFLSSQNPRSEQLKGASHGRRLGYLRAVVGTVRGLPKQVCDKNNGQERTDRPTNQPLDRILHVLHARRVVSLFELVSSALAVFFFSLWPP